MWVLSDQQLTIQVFMTKEGDEIVFVLCIFQMPRDLLFLTLALDCHK